MKYMFNGKSMIVIVGLIKRYCYMKMSYFPPYNYSKNKLEINLALSNYATGADTEQFAKKDDLANLKSEVDKLDIGKLCELDADNLTLVSKLNDVAKNDVVIKDVYNAKIKNIEDKISDITNLGSNTNLNTEINEAKNEIPGVTNLATNSSLNAKINEVKVKYLVLLT